MEASTITLLRGVALLCMLVLSSAAAPAPEDSVVIPNTSTFKCLKQCAVSCGMDATSPIKYAMCFGPCMATCKAQPPSDVTYGCTRGCMISLSKVMPTGTKASISDLTQYVEGYADSCYQSCSRNRRLY